MISSEEKNVDPEADTEEARLWRDSQRERLTETNALIAELGSEFESDVPEVLDTERRRLETIVSSFKYPIHAAPVEIIRQVLIQCLPVDGRVRPLPHTAPLLLARICRRWREITMETYELWTSFDFTFHSKKVPGDGSLPPRHGMEEPQYQRAATLLETWFNRTNGRPLSLTLRCSETRRAIPNAFLSTISKFSQQLARLEITPGSRGPEFSEFCQDVQGPFPLLSNLSLHRHRFFDAQILQLFENSPRLREVKLLSGFNLGNVAIGAARLTRLELTREISFSDLIAIFHRFPTLIDLKLSLDAISIHLPSASIENAPPLQSLHINSSALLGSLTLPYLRQLGCTIGRQDQVTMLLEFVARSACVLRELSLRQSEINDYAVVEFLQTLPLLEVLRVDYTEERTTSIRPLYTHLESPTLLPHLRMLSIADRLPLAGAPGPGATYRYAPVVAMLQVRARARRGARVQLTSFELALHPMHRWDRLDKDHVFPWGIHAEKIGRLVKGGLRFRVQASLGIEIDWPSDIFHDDVLDFPAFRPLPELISPIVTHVHVSPVT
ncbi:hypothetical protein B0H19DRAFT_1160682 [Mycena capillaripes]|nr:hypothetical protein B0H19DRAFT_1160682 [Mycena capillaripes]